MSEPNQSPPQHPPKKQPWQVLLLVLVTGAPIFGAWFFASHPTLLSQRGNYGELIIPPKPLDLGALLAEAKAGDERLNGLPGHWVLLQVSFSECPPSCRQSLADSLRVWQLLHKDALRVRRVLLLPSPLGMPANGTEPGDAGLSIGPLTEKIRLALSAALGTEPPEGTVLMLDPLGNLMMRYAPGFDAKGLLKDVKHLLRASQIG